MSTEEIGNTTSQMEEVSLNNDSASSSTHTMPTSNGKKMSKKESKLYLANHTGRVGCLLPDQEDSLNALIERLNYSEEDLKSRGKTVPDLLRFLRARQFDANAAEEMFRGTLQWREEVGADSILDIPDPNEHIWTKVSPHCVHKFDKKGRPVYWERSGLVDVPELLTMVDEPTCTRRHIWHMERMVRKMDETGAEQLVVIMDLKGLSLFQKPDNRAMKLFRESIEIDQNHYPERLGDLFILNAPWIFSALWKIIQLWLHPVTKAKFHILGSDYKEKLLEYFDSASLPEEYGGTCKCEDGCVPGKASNYVELTTVCCSIDGKYQDKDRYGNPVGEHGAPLR